MTDFTLRASAAPLAFRCAGSIRRGDVVLNESHDAANAGTAAHDALRSLAETGHLDWDSIPEIAARHFADPDEVRLLAALGSKLWPSVAESFPRALTEVDLAVELAPGVTLTGHADLLAVTSNVARGGDWKTGRRDSDNSHQLRAYCVLVLADNPELEEVTFAALWVRDQEIENYTMRRAEAEAWIAELLRTVVDWDGVYRPGSHCKHCPRSHECPAANALIRRDIAALSDQELVERAEAGLATMPDADIVELFRKADVVTRYADRVKDAIKARVLEHGDVVANGVRLTIDTEERRQLVPLKAWPVLESAGFEDPDFAACVDIRISKAEKVAAQKAGRGKGAAAVRALKEKLEAADAVEVKEVRKLVQKRA